MDVNVQVIQKWLFAKNSEKLIGIKGVFIAHASYDCDDIILVYFYYFLLHLY